MLHLQRQTVSLEQLAPEPVVGRFFSDKGGAITSYYIGEGEGGIGYVVGDVVQVDGGYEIASLLVEEVNNEGGITVVSLIGNGGLGYFIGVISLSGGTGSEAALTIDNATAWTNEIAVGNCRNFLVVPERFDVEMSIEGGVYLAYELEVKWITVDTRTHSDATSIQFTGGFSKIRISYEDLRMGEGAGYLTAY